MVLDPLVVCQLCCCSCNVYAIAIAMSQSVLSIFHSITYPWTCGLKYILSDLSDLFGCE